MSTEPDPRREPHADAPRLEPAGAPRPRDAETPTQSAAAVSYTHLTLPTICSV